MGSHKILDLTDAALVAFIISEGAGTVDDVLAGKAVAEKPLPLTICASSGWSSPDGMEYTGNCLVTAQVAVLVAAFNTDGTVDTVAASGTRVSDTFDVFEKADPQALGAAITTALGGSYTCISCRITGGERDFNDDVFQETLTLELLCCPSALT